jgi:type IV pilus assembly protein PilO
MDINLRSISSQFQDLDWKDVGTWPTSPKVVLLCLTFLAVCALAWFFVIDDKLIELDTAQQEETRLKVDYKDRLKKSINLEALKKQKAEVTRYVADLEKQLPDKTEMDRLLSDINYAGISKGLQFEVFKPGADVLETYYTELPIAIKLSGSYHKLASFAADLAALPRIVTLNNISLVAQPANPNNPYTPATANTIVSVGTNLNGSVNTNANLNSSLLTMEAVAKTFRYLDKDERDKVAKLKNKEGGTK